MFTFSNPTNLKLWAQWSKNDLGLQIHCQVLSENTFNPNKRLPDDGFGVIIGMNPGALVIADAAEHKRISEATNDVSPTWHRSKRTTTHQQILTKLPQINLRLLSILYPACNLAIINPITVVDPKIKSAKATIMPVKISAQVKYAERQMDYLDRIPNVRWVWAAWSIKLNDEVAKAVYARVCEWTARTKIPVFYIESKQALPRVSHINTGITKKDQPIGDVRVIPFASPPPASSRVRRRKRSGP